MDNIQIEGDYGCTEEKGVHAAADDEFDVMVERDAQGAADIPVHVSSLSFRREVAAAWRSSVNSRAA